MAIFHSKQLVYRKISPFCIGESSKNIYKWAMASTAMTEPPWDKSFHSRCWRCHRPRNGSPDVALPQRGGGEV